VGLCPIENRFKDRYLFSSLRKIAGQDMDVAEPEMHETVVVSGRGGRFSDDGAPSACYDEQAINVRYRH
jgi:hypothetical protein